MKPFFITLFIVSSLCIYAQRPYIEFGEKQDTIPTAREYSEIIESLGPLGFNENNDWPVAPKIFSGFVASPFNLVFIDTLSYPRCIPKVHKIDYLPNPEWLNYGKLRREASMSTSMALMQDGIGNIDFLAWELPEPPKLLPITDAPEVPVARSIPDLAIMDGPIIEQIQEKKYWLHLLSGAVQFSQAYISPNWYQGGDNNITLLIDFLWNVKLNQVYHPNLMFESNVHYKLGLYSTPSDEIHKYSISEDLFQWNLTAGLKAVKKWYYSFNLQFKTQFLHNYEANSWTRKAAFLSPGELNVGVGMTYSTENKKKGITFKASLAPVAYNLKSCIDTSISPTQFGIKTGHKSISDIGSSADLVLNWQLSPNISWTSRLFAFTEYSYFTADLENTFNFAINRFLSTQIYVHGRFDSSAPGVKKGWKKWMLKEILSFGFSYAFSTIPKN